MDEQIRKLVFSRPIPDRLIESLAIAPLLRPDQILIWQYCGGRIFNHPKRKGQPQGVRLKLPPKTLQPREKEFLLELASGLTVGQIGFKHGINHQSVTSALQRAEFRLGADTIDELLVIATAQGIIRPAGKHKVGVPPATLGTVPEHLRRTLVLVCEGYENPEIARRLKMHPDSIKNHVKALLKLFGARNRTQLAALAVGGKIIDGTT